MKQYKKLVKMLKVSKLLILWGVSMFFIVESLAQHDSTLINVKGNESQCVQFYESGNIYGVGLYKKGVKSGLWIYFQENGQILEYGIFYKGKKHGKWFNYKHFTKIYRKGKLLKVMHGQKGEPY
ncbi:MAG: hypothetical protein ACI8Q1_003004 [Parvicella sp.]|jgi:hypothetical protein